jgi:hypothetical protein
MKEGGKMACLSGKFRGEFREAKRVIPSRERFLDESYYQGVDVLMSESRCRDAIKM